MLPTISVVLLLSGVVAFLLANRRRTPQRRKREPVASPVPHVVIDTAETASVSGSTELESGAASQASAVDRVDKSAMFSASMFQTSGPTLLGEKSNITTGNLFDLTETTEGSIGKGMRDGVASSSNRPHWVTLPDVKEDVDPASPTSENAPELNLVVTPSGFKESYESSESASSTHPQHSIFATASISPTPNLSSSTSTVQGSSKEPFLPLPVESTPSTPDDRPDEPATRAVSALPNQTQFSDLAQWSAARVSHSLESAGVHRAFVDILNQNGVDGQRLLEIDHAGLQAMGIDMLEARSLIMLAIGMIKEKNDGGRPPTYST
ncbi:hypothetical protein HDU97_009086 [Phlyctochytrium planicorne]|nr:hypothetical protein HDU97_009086 [Phlyctochytrium planicorne]